MRHRKKVKKLGRTASHRKALLQNIAASLIEHHQIRTTLAKAKAAQSHIEKLITYAKEDSVHSRRLAFKFLQNRTLVKKLFDEIAITYDDRKGGYTRVIKLGRRRGDGAELAILQLVGFEQFVVEETPKKKKRKKTTTTKAASATKSKAKKEAAEEPVEETPTAEKKPKAKKEAKKAKAEEKAEPEAVEEEKAEKPEKEAEEAKAEKKTKTKKAKKEDKKDSEEETEKS